jgi:hypothetical protein
MEEWCINPHFLDLGTSWRWVVSFTPRPLYPRERALGIHCIGGWVDPRAGLDHMEKWKFLTPPGLEPRPLSRPARSQSLYRLRYPGSLTATQFIFKLEYFVVFLNCMSISSRKYPQSDIVFSFQYACLFRSNLKINLIWSTLIWYC